MKKFFSIFAVAVALFATSVQAQNGMPKITKPVFAKGDNVVSATIGYGWGLSERVVWENAVASWFDGRMTVGVGAAVANCTRFWYDGDITDDLTVGAVVSFHYQFIDKLDTYIQSGLGFKSRFGYGRGFGLDYTTSLGARWYFNDNFAVNGELGYTAGSYIMAGVTWKF